MTAERRTADSRPLQRISGPEELLQAVPYLLGFHPERSLVLVGLDRARLVVTARLDLADIESGAAAHTIEALVRGGSTSVIAVVYDDDAQFDDGGLPWQELAWALEDEAGGLGAALTEALLVCRGRWWSFLCDNPDCCPHEGQELGSDPSAFTAAATYSGMVALPDRGAVEALLEPLAGAEREALRPVIEAAERAAVLDTVHGEAERHERSVKRALFAAARASAERQPTSLTDEQAARFAAALRVTALRDAVWLAIDDRRLDGRALWRELARRVPAPYDAAPLFLFGWASWRAGEGALAGIAAQRALDSVPTYTAALLLSAALTSAVNPRRMRKLRTAKLA